MRPSKTRGQLLRSACDHRAEIAQYFLDIAHWNRLALERGEAPIDADPHGQLSHLAEWLDRMIAREEELKRLGKWRDI